MIPHYQIAGEIKSDLNELHMNRGHKIDELGAIPSMTRTGSTG